MMILLNDSDRERIAVKDEEAAPVIEKCRDFLSKRLVSAERQNSRSEGYKIAPKLKKLAKAYGFDYSYESDGCYLLKKRMKRGHYISVSATSGPSRLDTRFGLRFEGLGFRHELTNIMTTPTNQKEFDACSENVFEAVKELEDALSSKLDELYDPTPEWFFPNMW